MCIISNSMIEESILLFYSESFFFTVQRTDDMHANNARTLDFLKTRSNQRLIKCVRQWSKYFY